MRQNIKRLNSDLTSTDMEKRTAALEEVMDLAQNNAGDLSYIPALLVVLDLGSEVARQMASWSLGKLAQAGIGDKVELYQLIASLSDNESEVRENAAWALGELAGQHIGTREELAPLILLLGDKAATIRCMTAWALGRLAQRMNLIDERSIIQLERLVSDESIYIRKGAEYALQRLRERL
ncbi:MAG: HEAT repeat domain-containing protein [Methanomassiliicoccales archaeon]|jgi:HEAT repeat protein